LKQPLRRKAKPHSGGRSGGDQIARLQVTQALTGSMIAPTPKIISPRRANWRGWPSHRKRAKAKPEIGNRLNRFGQRGMQPKPEVRNHLHDFGNLHANLGPAIYSEKNSAQP
jgi:hypothetical protein